jgi:HipA-like protein
MSETLVVVLEDAVAGTLTRSPGGRLAFAYDEEYRRRPETTPLSLSLPKQIREHAGARLEAWLWGLLPDNDAVLRRWGRQFHVAASSPFGLLSTPVGEDCAGAVRFVAPDRLEQRARHVRRCGRRTPGQRTRPPIARASARPRRRARSALPAAARQRRLTAARARGPGSGL